MSRTHARAVAEFINRFRGAAHVENGTIPRLLASSHVVTHHSPVMGTHSTCIV